MKPRKIFQYVPLTIGLAVLIIGAVFVPWHEVLPYFVQLTALDYGLILVLGLVFYLTRILRYSYILRTFEQPVSRRKIGLSYIIGQPISMIPGGEFYRSVLLKRHANVSMNNALPTVFIQSLTEGIGLVILALIGALIIGKYVIIVSLVAFFYMLVMLFIQVQNNGHRSHSLINRLPFINVSRRMIRIFFKKNKSALRGSSLLVLLATSFSSTIVLIVTIMLAAHAFDVELSVTEAMVAISLPLIIQYITFLPGGLGVNEQGSVGILLLMQVPLPAAVALTIVIRFVSLWFGLLLGVLAISYTKFILKKKA